MAVLFAGAVVLVLAARQRVPLPAALARVAGRAPARRATTAEPQVGGLGRFARPRDTPPNRL
jgi:hypothetical protein